MNASKNIWLVILFSVFFAYRAQSEVWRTPVVADCNIEGVECRLRPDKVFWFEGETPVFKVGLRNQGARRLYVILGPAFWELSVDGKWYHMDLSMAPPKLSPFPPGCWYDDINVSISKYWLSKGQLIKKLAPGEHTIQVAYFAHLDNKNFGSPAVRAVSNPVEIKILPKRDSSPETGIFFQWHFELDKEIPVSLRPKHTIPIYRVWPRTITFHQKTHSVGKRTEEIEATLRVDGLSRVKAKWRIKIELLDQAGESFGEAEVIKQISGRRRWKIFGGGIGRRQYKLHFSFGHQGYINIAFVKRFRISFEQVNEKPRITIENDGKGAWGKCVSGLQCRLRPEALSYNTEQTIRCKADVRNSGPWDFSIHKTQDLCELCIDRQWYRHNNSNEESSPFPWGQEYNDIIITPNTSWYKKNDHTPLELSPGKHIIQVAFGAEPSAEKPRPAVWFLSNQVEVEILPDNNN